jgi:hypothetical protein
MRGPKEAGSAGIRSFSFTGKPKRRMRRFIQKWAIIYGIYYSFFEVFPLVYPVDYNMNLGQIGLVFLCVL